MKFKAVFIPDRVGTANALMACVDKVPSDSCILKLEPERITIVAADSDVQAFVTLNPDKLFQEYRISSRASNAIGLQLKTSMLSFALKSGLGAPVVLMRLAQKESVPCLSFTVNTLDGFTVTQDVPVRTLGKKELEALAEPTTREPDVRLELPDVRALRPVVERMKSLSKQVTLDAGHDGCLSLQIRSEHATIRTYYRGLRAMLAADAPEQLTQARAVATVDIKQLLSTLQFHTLPVDTAMCCIVSGTAVLVYVMLQDLDGSMTFYLPVMSADMDYADE